MRRLGLEYFDVMRPDLADPAALAERMRSTRARARFADPDQRPWTIAPPPGWSRGPSLDERLFQREMAGPNGARSPDEGAMTRTDGITALKAVRWKRHSAPCAPVRGCGGSAGGREVAVGVVGDEAEPVVHREGRRVVAPGLEVRRGRAALRGPLQQRAHHDSPQPLPAGAGETHTLVIPAQSSPPRDTRPLATTGPCQPRHRREADLGGALEHGDAASRWARARVVVGEPGGGGAPASTGDRRVRDAAGSDRRADPAAPGRPTRAGTGCPPRRAARAPSRAEARRLLRRNRRPPAPTAATPARRRTARAASTASSIGPGVADRQHRVRPRAEPARGAQHPRAERLGLHRRPAQHGAPLGLLGRDPQPGGRGGTGLPETMSAELDRHPLAGLGLHHRGRSPQATSCRAGRSSRARRSGRSRRARAGGRPHARRRSVGRARAGGATGDWGSRHDTFNGRTGG